MKSYDKRIYYRPNKEPFHDPEWDEAEAKNERLIYYRQVPAVGIIIRAYKPSVAKLVMERTGWTLKPLEGERKE